ncbi:MAG: cupin domain-containing protein [Polyangiaceae bacterium]
MLMGNLLESLPEPGGGEAVDALVARRGMKFERIVSHGQASPTDFWYDQEQHEFVYLVAGRATLEFDAGRLVELRAGDWLQIDAHVRHRVHFTDPEQATVWLVAFFDA